MGEFNGYQTLKFTETGKQCPQAKFELHICTFEIVIFGGTVFFFFCKRRYYRLGIIKNRVDFAVVVY